MTLSPNVLRLDPKAEVAKIVAAIRKHVRKDLRRRGAVLGLSGGIDSSVSAALCARAFGPDRVLGLFMPETESSGDSLKLGRLLAESLKIPSLLEDISPALNGARCYERRDEFVRMVVPAFGPGWKCKLVLPGMLAESAYAIFSIVVESPEGARTKTRLTAEAALGIVAATNFKQRVRRMMEYYHADRLNYAVVGTPNRLEYDQGFFVKNGDGAADFKPIAHLYKTQVYQLAEYLEVPEEIRRRPPTTDTYTLEQTQDEFYFSLPLDKLDLCLWGLNHDCPPDKAAPAVGLTPAEVERIYAQIQARRRATRPLHLRPLLVEDVKEIHP
jgi:NAD+ synthase